MVDGEASVMMMAMISSNSLSRQGARTEFLVPGLGFLVAATQPNSFVEKHRPPFCLSFGAFISSGGEVEGVPEAATPHLGTAKGGPRLALVWAPCGSSPSRLLAP